MKGHRRIDLIFVSPNILPSITNIGYAPYDFSTDSDHRACLLEFNTSQLFGQCTPQSIASHKNRLLRTKDKVSVERFITEWFRLLSEQGAFSYRRNLEDDSATSQDVERLDALLGQCGKQAEKNVYAAGQSFTPKQSSSNEPKYQHFVVIYERSG